MLGLSQDEPESSMILEDFQTFMKGLISFPLYIPGSSYAKAVKVLVSGIFFLLFPFSQFIIITVFLI